MPDLPYDLADLHDIPGTTIFTADSARRAYHLHRFCMSLMKEENRQRFRADEAGWLATFPMTPEQRDAVLARDYNRMIALGGNIYFLVKIASTDGISVNLAAGLSQHSVARSGRRGHQVRDLGDEPNTTAASETGNARFLLAQ